MAPRMLASAGAFGPKAMEQAIGIRKIKRTKMEVKAIYQLYHSAPKVCHLQMVTTSRCKS